MKVKLLTVTIDKKTGGRLKEEITEKEVTDNYYSPLVEFLSKKFIESMGKSTKGA